VSGIIKLLSGTFVALALSVPAFAASGDEYANIHTVGVISALGDSIDWTTVGLVVFQNQKATLPIADWKLDDDIVQRVSAALQPRFAVKKIATDVSALESLQVTDLLISTPDLENFVRGLPASNGVDAYVIISKARLNDTVGGSNQNLWGLGVYRHPLMFGRGLFAVYADYRVIVIDARTGKQIDYGTSFAPDSSILRQRYAWHRMPRGDYAESPQTATAQQIADIKVELFKITEDSLGIALANANLLAPSSGPPGGAPAQ
jgi:hypothetical protein